MHHPNPSLSRETLLAWLAEQDCLVTEHQLVRWHKAGLLPRPSRKFLGRGKGTETYYPPGTERQALRLCQALLDDRSTENAAWALWLDGFPVTPLIRARLRDGFVSLVSESAAELDAFESDSNRSNAIDMADSERGGHATEKLRKDVGGDEFAFVVRALLEIVAGRAEAVFATRTVEREALLRAIKGYMVGVPNPSGITAEDFLDMMKAHAAELSPAAFIESLDQTSDSQLEELRNQLGAFAAVSKLLHGSAVPLPYGLFAIAFVGRFGFSVTRELIDSLIAGAKVSLGEILGNFITQRSESMKISAHEPLRSFARGN